MPSPLFVPFASEPHGGADGISTARIDFSVNSNPFAPSPHLLSALQHVDIHGYPDPHYYTDKDNVAQFHACQAQQVSFGNGSAELIYRISRAYLNPKRRVLIAAPTFGEYARAAHLCGALVREVFPYQSALPDAAPEVTPNITRMLHAIHTHKPTLVWICQPNNPTGHSWTEEDLQAIAAACQDVDALLILDLAYQDFLQHAPTVPQQCVQLYSLTKSFGMAGIRAGYTIAPVDVAKVLESIAPPWQLSSHAQVAIRWALSSAGQDSLAETLPKLHILKDDFQKQLKSLGYASPLSNTHYFLLNVAHAASFKERALLAGFRVRDCSSFGLPQYVRVSTQKAVDNQEFIAWLASLI